MVRMIKPFRPCRVVRSKDEPEVQSGLALTPAQVAEMTAAGVPISQPMAMQFFDGYRTLDFEPSLINRRGVDIVDAWEAQQDARNKLREAAKKTKAEGE